MAYKKREVSAIVAKAKVRLAAMKAIDTANGTTTNYGSAANPLTQVEVDAQIIKCEKGTDQYNQILDNADAKGNDIDADDATLERMFSNVLKSAPSQFGENANEIEMLGGTRMKDRKHPFHKPKKPNP